MTVEQAKQNLKAAKELRKSLDLEIKKLYLLVEKLGGNLPKPNLSDRNRNIYYDWKNGVKTLDLCIKYNLCADRIRTICQREKFRENKTG